MEGKKEVNKSQESDEGSTTDDQLLHSLTIKNLIMVVQTFKHNKWEIFKVGRHLN